MSQGRDLTFTYDIAAEVYIRQDVTFQMPSIRASRILLSGLSTYLRLVE